MATPAQWIEGARPRTLPAAISPVLVGTGAAAYLDGFVWWKALLALGVALALQIGVNYANDYSDGIRGTDENRVGPLRLVGSKVATPGSVKTAAFTCFGVGAVLGIVLCATTTWWLLVAGAASLLGAWFYTGGKKPYGYRALGEVSVFLFFGLVAVLGTTYAQAESLHWTAIAGAVSVGSIACALLVANNLRDIPTDSVTGKRTLAVVLGAARSRRMYAALVALAFVLAAASAIATPWALLAFIAVPLAIKSIRIILSDAVGPALIPVLKNTGLTELLYAVGLGIGLALGR
ncbi:1,4-dihydroxy-2-naphthoate polyprenyltransferase [Kribbella solani]|uniref:1,4-dihydroxy-2-naphthoate polyprenyltransferase n=1 Tax=Kribbella solani TaxID=236067 RepID=UPI0029AD4D25|nr:1,4-dihydroxy-2-naphthoate polyprenyltransferase [Kribbella solani]MDX2968680.1 1,4-dihydroxy-2-naphthoate polyprenyltransferase [Kribbella solani]MDX3000997.1 1,4-dihydroxy-2-naphthoate polyprenyltransferase [Kribbella solani]